MDVDIKVTLSKEEVINALKDYLKKNDFDVKSVEFRLETVPDDGYYDSGPPSYRFSKVICNVEPLKKDISTIKRV